MHVSLHFNDWINFEHIKSNKDDLTNFQLKIWEGQITFLKVCKWEWQVAFTRRPADSRKFPLCHTWRVLFIFLRFKSTYHRDLQHNEVSVVCQCYVNIPQYDIPYHHPISENKLLKACWIILPEPFLTIDSASKNQCCDLQGKVGTDPFY